MRRTSLSNYKEWNPHEYEAKIVTEAICKSLLFGIIKYFPFLAFPLHAAMLGTILKNICMK